MLLDGNVDVIVLTNDLGTRDSHVLPALSPNADHLRITFSLVWFCCHAAQGCASVSSICVQATMYSICGTSTVLCTLRSICLFWWETWKKLPWPRAPARTDNYSQLIDNQRMQRKSKESNRTMRWSKFRVCLGWQLFWRIFQLIQPKALLLSQTQCSPWAPALASPLEPPPLALQSRSAAHPECSGCWQTTLRFRLAIGGLKQMPLWDIAWPACSSLTTNYSLAKQCEWEETAWCFEAGETISCFFN